MKQIYRNINKYYTEKIAAFGATPQGVDWKDEASQIVRLEQLLRVIRESEKFTINDLGSGYGRLLFYLSDSGYRNFTYAGYDVSEEMIHAAQDEANRRKIENCSAWSFSSIQNAEEMTMADYTLASGIFNVKMHHAVEEWLEYVLKTLQEMDRFSSRGFAFNLLTKYSDRERMRGDLYYADPCYLFDICKTRFSRNVALLHDYDLYEFTVLVRKG